MRLQSGNLMNFETWIFLADVTRSILDLRIVHWTRLWLKEMWLRLDQPSASAVNLNCFPQQTRFQTLCISAAFPLSFLGSSQLTLQLFVV
ncbi:hypothetical protein NA56DRAFT_280185 [Hyaloscypha hepaticicola]|uniref:Uncharacterized protein n=1 Tax=Hyaloscypha hepaticicola TaxID=2082293 RepID=A0A2J6PSW6_9HELO|nr:hypothetical protein NA56DRAFT_280185 [Hyaloscypha hepaticicola]